MNRLEKFRESRRYRRKIFSSFFLFFSLLLTGICLVDYSVNSLMNGESRINIVLVQSEESKVEITLMNKKFRLDTKYIKKDMKKIRDFFVR